MTAIRRNAKPDRNTAESRRRTRGSIARTLADGVTGLSVLVALQGVRGLPRRFPDER